MIQNLPTLENKGVFCLFVCQYSLFVMTGHCSFPMTLDQGTSLASRRVYPE